MVQVLPQMQLTPPFRWYQDTSPHPGYIVANLRAALRPIQHIPDAILTDLLKGLHRPYRKWPLRQTCGACRQ